MSIGVKHWGKKGKKPGGLQMPNRERTPFGLPHKIDWNTGKHYPQLRPDPEYEPASDDDDTGSGGHETENPGTDVDLFDNGLDTTADADINAPDLGTETWTAGGDNGLTEYLPVCIPFDDEGVTTLYLYWRAHTWDKNGNLYSVGAPVRNIVDVPGL